MSYDSLLKLFMAGESVFSNVASLRSGYHILSEVL